MKKTIKRIYRTRLLLALVLFSGLVIWHLPDPKAPAGTLLHFLAVVAAGGVIGWLWYNRPHAEKRERQKRKARA
jgi:UDP-N-acetylmuramyl pentapeptide phosphotransferase/UDP-N-acetylglucosamine-1-phosphate transferase